MLRPLAIVALAFCLFAHAALAQTLDERSAAARRVLIADAQRASLAGDHHRALDLATRAGALRMSGALRRFLAEEHQALGDALHAFVEAQLCVESFERDTAAQDRARHLAACRTIVHATQSRLGTVVLQDPGNAPSDLHVTVGADDIPRALWGVPIPVEPGAVEIHAVAAHHTPLASTIHVEAGGTQTVVLALASIVESSPEPSASPPPSSSSPSPPPHELAAASSPPPSPRDTHPGDNATGSSGFQSAPWIVGGIGSAALSAAIVFAALRASAFDAYFTACPASLSQCPPSARGPYDDMVAYTTATNVAWIAGAVLAAAGGAWLGLRATSARRHRVVVAPEVVGFGVAVVGVF
jgi:hypothetical protein